VRQQLAGEVGAHGDGERQREERDAGEQRGETHDGLEEE